MVIWCLRWDIWMIAFVWTEENIFWCPLIASKLFISVSNCGVCGMTWALVLSPKVLLTTVVSGGIIQQLVLSSYQLHCIATTAETLWSIIKTALADKSVSREALHKLAFRSGMNSVVNSFHERWGWDLDLMFFSYPSDREVAQEAINSRLQQNQKRRLDASLL